ncbi:MAG: hypothetical protein EHM55_23595 [Acidobacteria bacterium]|nr:MAG: hypothetical protein EHM55_23595 [Acidobacteriota bacterium]
MSRAQAAPVFEALGDPLPAADEWPSWIAGRDRHTRARVKEGDETSIVHWFLFGTSFTDQPRVTSQPIDANDIAAAVNARLLDFERALAQSNSGERAEFARQELGTGATVRPRLLSLLERLMKEGETHARLAEAARALDDPSLEFAERSRMYRGRGLSSDTSVRINFAVEEALRGLIPVLPGPVRRVGVIGPGLDVSDKQEGYDFYAPQTIQPFAIMDSLIRLGLARPDALDLIAFDLSPRVNAHIGRAATRAREGSSYTLHLPLDGEVSWTPALVDYWRRFGDAVGRPVPATVPRGVGILKLRAVSVRPAVVGRISISDLNVTAQHLPLVGAERFDLIIGTNVFLYYDRLEQGLAMASVSNMLKPGGVLLSNNALVEVPAIGLKSIGYSKTLYSNRDEDGDLVIWYQKQ